MAHLCLLRQSVNLMLGGIMFYILTAGHSWVLNMQEQKERCSIIANSKQSLRRMLEVHIRLIIHLSGLMVIVLFHSGI